ncbi:AAA family ATPase, partial [Chloroflexota bacterium]
MNLFKIVIRNFKVLDEIELLIPHLDSGRPGSANFLSLIGENNVGKSSVLEALLLALPGTDISRPTLDHFPGRDEKNGPIEVELHFNQLDDYDRDEQGIRTHVHDDKYIIKKVWESPNSKPETFAYQPDFQFPDWFDSSRSMNDFRTARDGWQELLEKYEEEYGNLPTKPNNEFRG